MLDLVDIAKSWYRAEVHTPEQKALADERLAICDGCDQKKFNETLQFFKCAACGCPLQKKVYSSRGPVACPRGKWSN